MMYIYSFLLQLNCPTCHRNALKSYADILTLHKFEAVNTILPATQLDWFIVLDDEV